MKRQIAVYSICMNKPDLLVDSFDSLGRKAGLGFRHYVWDQATDAKVSDILLDKYEAGEIDYIGCKGKNVGQNIAANFMLDEIFKDMPDVQWIMRWDPDAIAHSRRFLKHMVQAGESFVENDALPILSPKITKLKHPPGSVFDGDNLRVGKGFVKYEVVRILGGICRLHPAIFFEDFRFNRFMPMGWGEAAEVADRVTDLAEMGIPWVTIRLPKLKVEHAYGEDGQMARYPKDFGFEREMLRHVGYGL